MGFDAFQMVIIPIIVDFLWFLTN